MDAVAEDTETGQKVAVEVSDEQYEDLEKLAQDRVSDERLQSFIDNLDISADAKALIASILGKAIKVGELVIRVGKRIIEIVVMLVNKYPNAAFGMILGLLVGHLVASIPILATVLGAFLPKIAAAFGLVFGYLEDIKDQRLQRKITEAAVMFSPLQGEPHVAQ